MLRVQDVTIELVRSETIWEPIQPLVPCDDWNANRATGGRVRWSDCSVSMASNPSGTRFLGQIDISSVALIVDLIKVSGFYIYTFASVQRSTWRTYIN